MNQPNAARSVSTAKTTSAPPPTATDRHESVKSEARRWKENHDKMQTIAKELSIKATISKQELEDLQSKHRNLCENHASMQNKYRAAKDELDTLKSRAEDSEAALESEWRMKANRYKAQHKDLSDKLDKYVREAESKLEKQMRDSGEENQRLHEELHETKERLKRQVSSAAKDKARVASELSEEHKSVLKAAEERFRQTRADHKQALASAEDQIRQLKADHKHALAGNEDQIRQLKANHKHTLEKTEASTANKAREEHKASLETAREEGDRLLQRLNDHKLALKNARRDRESLSREWEQKLEEIKKENTRLMKENREHCVAAAARSKGCSNAPTNDTDFTREESEQMFDELMDAMQETETLHKELKALTKRMAQVSRENEQLSKNLTIYKKEIVPEMKGKLKETHSALEMENKSLRTELSETHAALDNTKAKLARLKGEMPAVREKLAQGENMAQELGEAKTLVITTKEQLQGAKKTISDQKTVQAQLQEDVERFKSTAQAHAANVKACAHMLSNTDQVLRACVELHSTQQKDSPLSKALTESSAKVAEFLQRLDEETPGKKKKVA